MKKKKSVFLRLCSLFLAAWLLPVFPAMATEGDGFVNSISKTTVDSESGVKVYDELAEYFQAGESYSTAGYETYLSFDVELAVYCDLAAEGEGRRNENKRDVIVYAVNYAGERIGSEEDASILADYIAEGYVVVVVDYLHNPDAKAPDIEHSLSKLRTYLGSAKLLTGRGLAVDINFLYCLPAGYRLARDVWFWNSYYYSSLGTRDYVIKAWNTCMAEGGSRNSKAYNYTKDFTLSFDGLKADGGYESRNVSHKSGERIQKVEYIQECVGKDGTPLRYDVYMDIIYPSKPKKALPVYAMLATSPQKHSNTCTDQRCTFVGMTFSGYATATFDYAYVPMSNDDKNSYGYIDYYGTHGQNVLKSTQAAVRALRYYANDYGYDAAMIGVGGLSKGSPGTAAVAPVDNVVNSKENSRFELDTQMSAKYGVDFCFEGDMVADGKRVTLNQPFLYYDVPYGPILDENGNTQKDIYGNLITYDYYGEKGEQYVRATDEEESFDGFRIPTGKSYADYDLTKTESHGVRDAEGGDYRIDADVQASYCAAGDGAKRLYGNGNLASLDKVPMLLSCGKSDQYGCFDYWYALRDWFADNANAPFLAITMLDQGHVYPTAYDDICGYRRHDAFIKFFDHHLKKDTSPEIVYALPLDGDESVDENTRVEVKFYTAMDAATINEGLCLMDMTNGKRIEGTWTAGECDTLFSFDAALSEDTAYAVVATDLCRAQNGNYVKDSIVYEFGVPAEYKAQPSWTAGETVDADNIFYATFQADKLKGAETVTLTLDAVTEGGSLAVYHLPTADSTPTADQKLGVYKIENGKVSLDLSMLAERETGDSVTLALVSERDAYLHRYEMDFEDQKDGTASRDQTKDNHCFSEYLIAIGGAPKSYTIVTDANYTEGGTKSLLITATHNYDRVKFFNVFADRALTEADIGREFDISFQILTGENGNITSGIMSFNSGSASAGYTGPASTYGQAFCGKTKKSETDSLGWTEITDHITITAEMVRTQAGLYAIQTNSATATNNFFWIDDLMVTEIPTAYTDQAAESASYTISNAELVMKHAGKAGVTLDALSEQLPKRDAEETDDPTANLPGEEKPSSVAWLPYAIGAAVVAIAAVTAVILFKKKK